jgi:DNA-3-methyladenine glycosylase II
VLVRLPQPYDFDLSVARFEVYGRDRATLWLDGGIHRFFAGREVRIEAAPGGVDVTPHDETIEAEVLHFLGLPFDLKGLYAWAAADETLGRLATGLAGFRPPLQVNAFEALVTSITAQQVSLRSAFAVRNRLIERFGVRAGHAWSFPSEERMGSADEDELMELGFSRRKAEYVVGVARAAVDWDELATLSDEELKARLVALRGLGEWTADWFMARHLARPRAWPAGDLGLVKALAEYYFDGVRPSIAETRAFGERFAPFENLSAHYLLASLYAIP